MFLSIKEVEMMHTMHPVRSFRKEDVKGNVREVSGQSNPLDLR